MTVKKEESLKLYNLNCLEMDLSDFKVDIIFTSPPYNLGKGGQFLRTSNPKTTYGGPKYKKQINLDSKENWSEWMFKVIEKYINHTEYFFLNIQSLSPNKIDLIDLAYKTKEWYVDKIIWDKGYGVPTGFQKNLLMPCFEEIWILSKYGNKTKKINTKPFNSGSIKNIVKITKRNNQYKHLNQATFPKELCDFIVRNFVPKNGSIADIFMGTGTVGLSAIENNIKFIGIELDREIFQAAKERIYNGKNSNRIGYCNQKNRVSHFTQQTILK